ncbi:hypothetical protein JXA85_08295 [Candidatus Woesearchaeota archaeon]|nr:hypothetical protein [Candidatus Woesearchaeota archaeon]
MSRKKLIETLERLNDFLKRIEPETKKEATRERLFSFSRNKQQYFLSGADSCINELKLFEPEAIFQLKTAEEKEKARRIKEIMWGVEKRYAEKKKADVLKLIAEAKKEISTLKEKETFRIRIPRLPPEISKDVSLDLQEIERCFNAICFRSVTILCGRVLEIALHRKYFEITRQDILETQPGIGLGKLIAKLREKNFNFDPGITEQIHLINQVRITSVHKHGNNFHPTRQQAQAMILYTLDVLKKLFK